MIELKISMEDIVVQSPGLIASSMGGETVMLSITNGKYYNLGEIGGVIWSLLEKPVKVKALIHSLLSEYEVDLEVCEQEVLPFLDHLLNEGIIQSVE